MWPGLVQTAKEGGVDVIECSLFWNGHELSPGKVSFLNLLQWGVPVWLHYVNGTVFRTDNEPFKHYMQNFTTFIVNLMKQEKLFAPQGGPIVLAQASSASGNGSHSPFKFENPILLKAGKNEIALLSMTLGLQIGLQGEHLGIYKPDGLNGVNWVSTSEPPNNQPLTWYKVVVDPPSGDEPVGLDMIHMGKDECDYRGKFFPDKCLTGCGEPSQRWYHVLKPSGNILVIFEEKGEDPTKITFSKRKTSSLCSHIAEDFPMVDRELVPKVGSGKSAAHLKCPKDTLISSVKLASFGNPTGRCGSYSKGDCHDPNSTSVVEKACVGKKERAIELTEENFDRGLCPGTTKKLAIEAVCS
ncbi:NAD-dependent ADP-ribosyltransferase sirtuin-4-like [Hibiscus syriacus]|uniref:beta-galactosidase n=1 Tax=Hibiscus syriacus TaxID=106335 RepID=A0A6A3AQ60_HIBSY|nr:NAD-dependent ADP-ribosyltransferase sirtuin-4-like [Hibiscus syriacus]